MADNETVSINSEIIETVIGARTRFKGSVETDKPFRIDGYFEGDIISTNMVVVSESGSFKGTVSCRELNLYGRGEGKVQCSDLMNIAATGVFSGDVITKDLNSVRGSVLDGTCLISKMRPN